MIGKLIDVTNFNRQKAVEFIRTRCTDCDIYYFCNGADAEICNDKVDYLLEKFGRKSKGENKMIVTGMDHFQSVSKRKLVDWYNKHCEENHLAMKIDLSNVFIVWSCKTLQNYKCLASTTVSGDGIYAEYTYNGDKQELYEDVYKKLTNACHTEE